MASSFVSLMVFALAATAAGRESTAVMANPIRKVVTMLQSMQKKVAEEGEVEQKLFDKFMCYCNNGDSALAKSISDAEAKMPELTSDIEAAEAEVKQLKADLETAKTDRAAAKASMAEATTIREKEAGDFASLKAEADANIEALTKATTAIEKGMAGSFLQTRDAQVLKQLVLTQTNIDEADRDEITAFLTNAQNYAPSSGSIVGIMKQITDTMNKELAEATAAETAAIKAYEELMAAKQAEVKS